MIPRTLEIREHECEIADYVASRTRYTMDEVFRALDKFVAQILEQGAPKEAGDADGD